MKKLLLLLLFLFPLVVSAQISVDSIKCLSPSEGLFSALLYYKVQEPYIVFAQAVLETGHFKSELSKKGNLFGIYDSKNRCYKTYQHWIESVLDYKHKVQNKYKGGDYYEFLERIGYASDPKYIEKLRRLEKQFTKYD